MFQVREGHVVTTAEKLLWNISKQLAEINSKLDRLPEPKKRSDTPPPPLETAGQPNK